MEQQQQQQQQQNEATQNAFAAFATFAASGRAQYGFAIPTPTPTFATFTLPLNHPLVSAFNNTSVGGGNFGTFRADGSPDGYLPTDVEMTDVVDSEPICVRCQVDLDPDAPGGGAQVRSATYSALEAALDEIISRSRVRWSPPEESPGWNEVVMGGTQVAQPQPQGQGWHQGYLQPYVEDGDVLSPYQYAPIAHGALPPPQQQQQQNQQQQYPGQGYGRNGTPSGIPGRAYAQPHSRSRRQNPVQGEWQNQTIIRNGPPVPVSFGMTYGGRGGRGGAGMHTAPIPVSLDPAFGGGRGGGAPGMQQPQHNPSFPSSSSPSAIGRNRHGQRRTRSTSAKHTNGQHFNGQYFNGQHLPNQHNPRGRRGRRHPHWDPSGQNPALWV